MHVLIHILCVTLCPCVMHVMCAYFTYVWPHVLSVPPGDLTEGTRWSLGPQTLRGHLGNTWSLTAISDQDGSPPHTLAGYLFLHMGAPQARPAQARGTGCVRLKRKPAEKGFSQDSGENLLVCGGSDSERPSQ